MVGQSLESVPGRGWFAMLAGAARGVPRDRVPGDEPDPRETPLGASDTAAIVFADVCGSTPLYQAAGDRRALELVSACIDNLARIAREAGGDVVRSKGDDLLCTFADPGSALVAGRRMIAAQRKTEARVRVGVHHGALIRARGDIFGDAVNIAARLLGLGKPNEVLATEALYRQLPTLERATLRRLGEHTLDGASEPVAIYAALSLGRADSTTLRGPATDTLRLDTDEDELAPAVVLSIECGDVQLRCAEGETLRIGRSPECDMVVPLSWVSREHATVSMRRGKLTLKDHSSSGTRVDLADGHQLFVRRETIVLTGSGVITPGGHQPDEQTIELRFRVLQTA